MATQPLFTRPTFTLGWILAVIVAVLTIIGWAAFGLSKEATLVILSICAVALR